MAGFVVNARVRPPDPQLRDDVVALRPWRDEDVPAKVAAFGDPETYRCSWPKLERYTDADAWAMHEEHRRTWAEGTAAEFACVEPNDDAAVIGGASLYDIDREARTASVGYWVVAPKRRQGVGHAIGLIARWAFDDLQIIRLQLTCGPDNVASQRVAERCRFTKETLLRSHLPFKEGRRDTVVSSKLAPESRT